MTAAYIVSCIVHSRGQALPGTKRVPVNRIFQDDDERYQLIASLTSDIRTALGNPAATVEILSIVFDLGAA